VARTRRGDPDETAGRAALPADAYLSNGDIHNGNVRYTSSPDDGRAVGLIKAFGLGTLAQSSLLLAGLLACWVKVPTKIVGILAGFGAGAMISAVSFDLIPEAEVHIQLWQTVLWMLIGVAIFLLGDRLVEKRFGSSGAGGAMGIVVGSVVDGVPESLIFGIQIGVGAAISAPFLAAVFVSNIPQAIAPSADLAARGWSAVRLGRLWLMVVLGCGLAAALGYLTTNAMPDAYGERAAALAAGGLLAMLTNSLIPFAYERGKEWAGVATVIGFCLTLLGT
jgi:ZIP family zinc transporter